MTLGDIIKQYRTENGMSMDVFAKKSGLSKAYVSILERNYNPSSQNPPVPSLKKIKAVSDAVGIDFNELLTMIDSEQLVSLVDEPDAESLPAGVSPLPKLVKKPRLGTIACGRPILAVEEAEVYDEVPEDIICDFTLKCSGDSMINARIFDGDIVYIKQQDIVENGEIAAVVIEDEATLKRVYYTPGNDCITLRACNPLYPDLVYSGETLDEIHILGKAVAFTSRIK
ncbi:MAG: XRE family transcriptional regulator [Oscillospiraceae bacterium]|nr:XRE family transcriptional regulator [Oscillospiraceae bacterium]